MRPVLLIAWREYKQYILSRGFLLFLLMFPVGVLAIGGALGFLERAKPLRTYVIYDQTGRYADAAAAEMDRRFERSRVWAWDAYVGFTVDPKALEEKKIPSPFAPARITRERIEAFEAAGLDAANAAVAPFLKAGAPPFTESRRQFHRLPLPPEVAKAPDLEAAVAALRPYLLGEKRMQNGAPLFAAVFIPADYGSADDAPPAEYWSRNLTDTSLQAEVGVALDFVLQKEAAARSGLSGEALEEVAEVGGRIQGYRADKAAAEAELSLRDRIETTLPAAMTYMLLVIIFGAGNLLLTNTIEERSNKIVEVLLSSVTADQLMMGKLIGIAAVGLTMPTIFAFGGLVAALGAGDGEWARHAVSALIGSNLLAVYLFYFLCAYMIFAMIFLAIGAVSNSLQDAQSFMGPVMLIVFLPLPFMLMVYQNPNGVAATILTWIPVYTPYAVMMRAASDPPMWEILGATALMLAFAIVLTKAMGRIFRQAILQAAPPKAADIWRLLKSEKR
jgi:ABC-2 type transport system permease protein